MKCVLFVLCCLFVGLVVGAAPAADLAPRYGELTIAAWNPVNNVWKLALEYVRSLLKKYEPFKVPDMPTQTVEGEGIKLMAKFDNVLVSNASDFVINSLENHMIGMWATFEVTVPQMNIEADFTVTGSVHDRKVQGKGHFILDIDKLTTGGNVKLAFVHKYLQMTELKIHYTIDNLKLSETGLEVEGMTQEQLQELFSTSFLKYFKENEEFVCSQVSLYVMEQTNKIMYGKNLKDWLKWMWDFVHGGIIH